jgi:hypothetical protein
MVSLGLCGCCEACECIDAGYEASAVFDRVAVGDHSIELDFGRAVPLAVRERDRCHPVAATGISVVGPDDTLRVGGPRLWWARIQGNEWLCCVDPLPVVDEVRGAPDAIALELASCVETDCDCEPKSATPFVAWHSLGELAPGTYEVRVGTRSTSFTVP